MSCLRKLLHSITEQLPTPFWRATQVLVTTAVLVLLWTAAPASAQLKDVAQDNSSIILGTVVDMSNDPIPDATVTLEGPGGDRRTGTSKEDGSFAFQGVTPGVVYQVTVTADGFASWNSSVSVAQGQPKALTDIKLHILTVQRSLTVHYAPEEVAARQLKAEEQQRVLGFIPNIYVTYDPDAEPLTTRMKFHLAYKSLTNPMFFARVTAWAGVQQTADTPAWPQNAEGFGKRVGAAFADSLTEDLVGNAILPSVLHQDPRYFYQGVGTKKSRARHAFFAAFICKGDNGQWQPNYSTWGGSLISSSVSMAYYPQSSRDAAHVFRNFGIGMGLHVAASFAQEFILGRFTSKGAQ